MKNVIVLKKIFFFNFRTSFKLDNLLYFCLRLLLFLIKKGHALFFFLVFLSPCNLKALLTS